MSTPEILSKIGIGSGLNNSEIIGAIVDAETVATTKTVVIQFSNCDDGGKSADADLGSDTVFFMIWVKNSGVT